MHGQRRLTISSMSKSTLILVSVIQGQDHEPGWKEKFSVFSGNTQSQRLHAALVAEHSMLSGRQVRTTWTQISFVCVARCITQMQQNEGASDQAVQSLKSTCFGCRPAQHHAQTHASRCTICTWFEIWSEANVDRVVFPSHDHEGVGWQQTSSQHWGHAAAEREKMLAIRRERRCKNPLEKE